MFRKYCLYLQAENESIQPMNNQTMQQNWEYFQDQTRVPEGAWLFGSYARGEEREDSDVDILVVLDHSQKNPQVSL